MEPPAPVETTLTVRIAMVPSIVNNSSPGFSHGVAELRAPDGALIAEGTVSTGSDQILVDLAATDVAGSAAHIFAYLADIDGNGARDVHFSGRSDAITIRAGAMGTHDVGVVRGPIDNVFASSVSITSPTVGLEVGEQAQLTATADAPAPYQPVVFWGVEGRGVATVGDDGRVEAIGPGTALLVAGAGVQADTIEFTVSLPDTTAPKVVAMRPIAATDVSVDAVFEVDFSEAMDLVSLEQGGVKLETGLGNPVAVTYTHGNETVTLTPAVPLEYQTAYRGVVTKKALDLAGNPVSEVLELRFETRAPPTEIVATLDPASIDLLVAVGHDALSGDLFVYDAFAAEIARFRTDGTRVLPSIARPGNTSNEFDLDFLDDTLRIGGTLVPSDNLLVLNADHTPATVYAVDRVNGGIIASVELADGVEYVGASHHRERGTLFALDWARDEVVELDASTGAVVQSFSASPPGSPSFDVFFGDVEVEPNTGSLMLVSSQRTLIRILSPDGAWLRDVIVTHLGIGQMSGIAWDAATSTAWVSTIDGTVVGISNVF